MGLSIDLSKFYPTEALKDIPALMIGDKIRIQTKIREGDKERLQPFEGTIIAQRRAGMHTTITVRKYFQGIGIERVIFPGSPQIVSIKVLQSSKIRRAKLYYLRERQGKAARLRQKFNITK
uniref:Large ribosomal subunit protein bL19c n=1 Tax=prasinophyte sp. MBIC10622 TaxID=156113 RepID=A0A088CIU1_9CHLO|nr:ribosomal protein L19 [prasinophyte sp. MBIC10622]